MGRPRVSEGEKVKFCIFENCDTRLSANTRSKKCAKCVRIRDHKSADSPGL